MEINEAIFRDYDIGGIVGKDLDWGFAFVFGKVLVRIWHEKASERHLRVYNNIKFGLLKRNLYYD